MYFSQFSINYPRFQKSTQQAKENNSKRVTMIIFEQVNNQFLSKESLIRFLPFLFEFAKQLLLVNDKSV